MKTWVKEILVVAAILFGITLFVANNWINWITTIAVLLTFNHCQIADRLQERQGKMDRPTVECYWRLNKIFTAKEVFWIVAFILMRNYAAIAGSALFALYPMWRSFYRSRIKPLKILQEPKVEYHTYKLSWQVDPAQMNESIDFAQWRDKFKRQYAINMREHTEKHGMITWDYPNDAELYALFKEQANPATKNNSSLPNNK